MAVLASDPPGGWLRGLTQEEVRLMATDRAIVITVAICATVFACFAVATMAWLAMSGYGTVAVLSVVGGLVTTVLTMILNKLRSVHNAVTGGTEPR